MLILFDHENMTIPTYYRCVKEKAIADFGFFKWTESRKESASQKCMIHSKHSKSWNNNIKMWVLDNNPTIEVADDKLVEIATKYRGNTIVIVTNDLKLVVRLKEEMVKALTERGASKSKIKRLKVINYNMENLREFSDKQKERCDD